MKKIRVRLFITGIYRSGTTLVAQILNNHPDMYVTYDSVHFMRFSHGKYDPIHSRSNASRLIDEIHSRMKKRLDLEFDRERVLEKVRRLERIEYGHIYDLVMKSLLSRHKKDAIGWAEKTNVCWGKIPGFLEMFPSGKAIHIIRDPRDVMCSYRDMTYEPAPAYLDSAFCSLHAFTKAGEYRSSFSPDNYHLLKYEDLLRDPAGQTRKICRFLGIRFVSGMLDTKKFRDPRGKRWHGHSSFARKITTISEKPIGRWRKNAAPFEIFLVELVNRPVMKAFGYELSGIELRKPERDKLFRLIKGSRLLSERYRHWLKTGEGVEGYPSNPLVK